MAQALEGQDIQSFLGFANFYCCFIYNYSDITVPLTHLTHKGTLWFFSDDCHKSFKYLKLFYHSSNPHVLGTRLTLVVETNASDYALTVIISMHTLEGKLHAIAFHSHTLTGAKLNYDVHSKELMAIFEAFKCWRHHR